MSTRQSHPSDSRRLIDRRSVLRGVTAGLAGAIAGVQPLQAQSVTEDELNQLLAMDDGQLRKDIATTFIQYLKCRPAVKATFFPDTTPPDIKFDRHFIDNRPDPISFYSDPVAEALVAWSLANTSSYGFNKTVNGQHAASVVKAFSSLKSPTQSVEKVSHILYVSMFPQTVKAVWTPFSFFLDRSKRNRFALLLADTMLSDHFFDKTMARKKADPANFPQYLHLQCFKLQTLIEDHDVVPDDPRFQKAFDKWSPYTAGQPWTIYQYLTDDKFSEQTFMPEVQTAIGAATVVSHHSGGSFCAGGKVPQCHSSQIPDYNHGLAVEAWLKGSHVEAQLFTGAEPDNKQ